MLETIWPVWGIRITTPRLELRPVREAEMLELIELADRGIHDPATMPFLTPWTDEEPPMRQRNSVRFYMRSWAEFGPDGWQCPFAAYLDGVCVGRQDISARRFGVLRSVETASWLGRDHQGVGLGKELRAAVLHLAFEVLGARRATTGAFEDNAASLGVTRAMGYRPGGDALRPRREGWGRELLFVMDESDWRDSAARKMPVTVEGVDAAVLEQLGAG